ncbi:hypothetical protein SAMN05216302_10048 [Nitrosomonas aestuarii]|uniref:Uncharacterized protein n=1 Tax=Nitrosomonas aestuarii TaxID=52441 RepID=A0A1I3YJQ3_9PROT|nr:hypothetical protein [Nitrosomonas aestuarii]SFK31579.1 hypothetical protein SAMN05216302_10048 [Nitrosomonas aestuarii]
MLEKVKVTGMTYFDDEIDGKHIDSGSVFIEEQLNFQTGRAKGTATQKYPLGKASLAKALAHLEFPLICEVEFVRVTNGNFSKNIVNSLKPLGSVKAA